MYQGYSPPPPMHYAPSLAPLSEYPAQPFAEFAPQPVGMLGGSYGQVGGGGGPPAWDGGRGGGLPQMGGPQYGGLPFPNGAASIPAFMPDRQPGPNTIQCIQKNAKQNEYRAELEAQMQEKHERKRYQKMVSFQEAQARRAAATAYMGGGGADLYQPGPPQMPTLMSPHMGGGGGPTMGGFGQVPAQMDFGMGGGLAYPTAHNNFGGPTMGGIGLGLDPLGANFKFGSDNKYITLEEKMKKARSQMELQGALERQIAEKKMIKERHKQAEKDEEERESARLKAEQERMKREFDEEHKEKQKADFKNAKQQVADAWQKAKEESERLKRAKFAGKRKGKEEAASTAHLPPPLESTEWPPGLEEFFPAPDQFSPGPLQITLPPLPPQPPLPMTPNTAAKVGRLAAEEIGRARREMAAEAEELRKVVVDQTFQVAALKSHAEQWGSEAAQAKEDVQRMRSDMIISSIAFPEAMLRVMSDYPKPAQPSYTSILDYAFPELQAVRQRQPLPSKAPMSHSLALPPTAKANTHDPPSPPKPFRTASASLNTASIDIPAKYLSQSISLPIKASLHQPSAASPTRTSVGGAITLLPTRDSPIALHLLPTMARTGSSPHRGVPHSQSVPLLPTMANSQPGIDVAAKWLAYAEAHPPGTKANANAVGSGARRAGGGAWGASGKSPSQGLGYDMGSLIQGVPNQAVVKYRSTHEAVGLYRDGPARPPTQGLRKVDPLHASLATESVLVYPAGREVPAGSRPRHLMSHSSSYLNESLVQIRSALQGDLSKQAATLNSVPEPSPIILPPGTAQSTMSTNSSYADVARGIKGGARGPIELMNNLQTNAAKLKLLKGMNSGSGQKSTEAMEAFLTKFKTTLHEGS